MKKIINGRKYDTSTAKQVGYRNFDARFYTSCFTETLFLKTTGEFFLLGEGGCNSIYGAKDVDGSYIYGERIIPYSEKEAREWAERYLDVDAYEAIFGEVAE